MATEEKTIMSMIMLVVMASIVTQVTQGLDPGRRPPPGGEGDVNMDGWVNEEDKVLVQEYLVGSATLTAEQLRRADVSGDGAVTIGDALLIAQYYDHQIDSFPVTDGNGVEPIPGLADLYGVITDASTGSAISGAVFTIDAEPQRTATSNVNGVYLLEDLAPGNYIVWVVKAGYEPVTGGITIAEGNNELNVEMSSADVPAPILVDVYGDIMDAHEGGGIPGATIKLSNSYQYDAVSDPGGSYVIKDVYLGSYFVVVEAEGYETVTGTIEVTEAEREFPVDMEPA